MNVNEVREQFMNTTYIIAPPHAIYLTTGQCKAHTRTAHDSQLGSVCVASRSEGASRFGDVCAGVEFQGCAQHRGPGVCATSRSGGMRDVQVRGHAMLMHCEGAIFLPGRGRFKGQEGSWPPPAPLPQPAQPAQASLRLPPASSRSCPRRTASTSFSPLRWL